MTYRILLGLSAVLLLAACSDHLDDAAKSLRHLHASRLVS